MAVKETLELDLRGALAQVGTLEREIQGLRKPVNIPVDVTGSAESEIKTIDDRLDELVSSSSDLNRELAEMAIHAGDSVTDFSRLANEMGIAEGQARDLAGEILEARNSSVRVADAAKDVARQMGLSEDEAAKFADEVNRAAGKVDNLDTAASKASGGGLAKLGAGLKGLLVTAAAFVGVREIFSFLSSSIQSFSNLEESTSKANVVFGDFADTIFRFTSNAPEELGQTQQAAIEAAASFGNLFLSIGLGQQDAAAMSITLVQLATDLSSFNNISVEEAMEKLRSGLIGEAEPLRSVGVLLSEAAVQTKALELGLGGVTGKLTEAEKVQARYAIILEKTTTAQGDFAMTSDGVAGSQRKIAAAVEELKTKIGEALAPLLQTLLAQAPQLVAQLEDLIPPLSQLAAALGDLSSIGGPIIGFFIKIQAATASLEAAVVTSIRNLFSATEQGDVGEIVILGRVLKEVRDQVAAGEKPMRAFGSGLVAVTERTRLTVDALHELADATGATAQEQAEALRLILDNPGTATTEELVILRNALVDVEEQMRGASEAQRDYQFIASTLAQSTDESNTALSSQATVLFLLRSEADLLGISLSELIAGGAEKFPELAGLIGQLEPATLGLATAQENLNTFALSFEETNIRISDAIDEFGLLPDKIEISKKKFLANLTVSAAEEAEFQADLVALFAVAPALATRLQAEGPAARGLVDDFLADLISAERAEDILTGEAEDVIGVFTDAVATQIETSNLDQEGIDALELFLEGFGNTAVAEAGVQALGQVIQQEIDKLKFTISGGQFSFEGGLAPGVVPGGSQSSGVIPHGPGIVITNNVYYPTDGDLPTAMAQANQSTAAVGTALNRVVGS